MQISIMGNATYKTKEEYERSFVKRDNFRSSYFGGERGLGDPQDESLGTYEKRIILPTKRKEIILDEYCSDFRQALNTCHMHYRHLRRYHCRKYFLARNECIRKFWNAPGLEERAHNEYLAARSLYRRTGELPGLPDERKGWFFDAAFRRPKTWEEYQMRSQTTVWQDLKNRFFGRKAPDLSIQEKSECLHDSWQS